MYGWDIMPRLVSAGIWRDVYLEPHKKDKIVNTYYFTSRIAENEAELTLQWQFQTDHFDLSSFSLQLTGICGESCFQRTIQPESTAGQTCLKINKPLLWWPKGYGEANLYQITLELWRNNQRLDQRTEKIGLRRIQLVNTQTTTEEQPGNFYFICNDHKIMIKGANHVPIDALHSRDQKNLLHTMELYNDLGCNMIRCWGGNVYEDHAFFDFCDDHGIMVWQDFALACAFYPQADDFQSQMEKEAGAIIRKLRNHPSLVLWAGDNEIDMFLYWHNIDPARNRLSRETLPRAVARCDPHRSFLPSSPYLGPELIKQGDMALSPEQHLWGARNFYKKPFYSQTRACFASEIGWHGCPNISSLRKFLSEDKLWPWQDNSQWMTHATNPAPQSSEYQYRVKLMVHQINELFGFVPDNLKDFVRASQISQAEAMKYFIELFRTQKWDKSGIIWWNLKDGWPQFSEAAVDYYFSKKLVYYYIKRVQYPVCLMMQDPVNGLSAVIAANDTLEYVKGSYIVWIAENRKTVVSGSFDITPNVNKKLASIEIGESTPQMYIIEYEMEGKKFGNHYVAGNAPIDFQKYSQEWLKIICALPDGLNYENIGQ
jgi:beta-mannosidase